MNEYYILIIKFISNFFYNIKFETIYIYNINHILLYRRTKPVTKMNWTDTKKKEWVDAGIMTFEHAYKMTFTQVKKKDTADKKKAKQLVIKNRKRYIALWKSAIMHVIANSFDSRRKKFFDELPLSWRLKRMTYNHYKPVVGHHVRNLKKT